MRDEKILRNLLQVMLDEWGPTQVEKTLARVANRREQFDNDLKVAEPSSFRIRKFKPTPSELVQQGGFDGEKKDILLKLAVRFEQKDFLPGNADVREFMFNLGERPIGIKDRKNAFRILLQGLSRLSIERLRYIEKSAQHSGPSQLGPLSDAIANVSSVIRKQLRDDEAA